MLPSPQPVFIFKVFVWFPPAIAYRFRDAGFELLRKENQHYVSLWLWNITTTTSAWHCFPDLCKLYQHSKKVELVFRLVGFNKACELAIRLLEGNEQD
jgi:hypothetical protein